MRIKLNQIAFLKKPMTVIFILAIIFSPFYFFADEINNWINKNPILFAASPFIALIIIAFFAAIILEYSVIKED